MNISEGRINQLSRKIAKGLINGGQIEAGLDDLSREVKRGMVFFTQKLEALDGEVREKITSIKRGVLEGSAEYEILYRQYFTEELNKL